MALDPLDYGLLSATDGAAAMRRLFSERSMVGAHLRVEAALARAEARAGVIPPEAAGRIAEACRIEALDLDRLRREAGVVGYPVVPLVEQLAAAAGPAGGWVHWGATTQDVMDTALVLLARDAGDAALADLGALREALRALVLRHAATPMAGRSKLQHAAPITFGYKAAVWLSALDRQDARLRAAMRGLLVVQFGGAVGTLASLGRDGPAVRRLLAEELGLAEPAITWHVARDALADAVSALALLTACLAKIATDVSHMMATEVGEVREPYLPGRGSSSTMPQKRNPVLSEAVLAAAKGAREVAGLMLDAVVQDHERASHLAQLEQHCVARAFVLAGGALDCSLQVVRGLEVDEAAMRRNLDATRGLIMAEAAMMRLAPALGRDAAHRLVHEACRAAARTGVPLADALAAVPEVAGVLTPAQIAAAMAPEAHLGVAEDMARAVAGRGDPPRGG
jgi:3-carboxy-cis,cis-muconate cycloisomerase